MDLIKYYGSIIKNNIDTPSRTRALLKTGYSLNYKFMDKFPNHKLPSSLQYLEKICMKFILEPLKYPKQSAMVNLFAPCEFLHALNIYPMFVEGTASYLSGTKCEDAFIDYAEKMNIPETLCSYHKTFIGAAESNILPKPRFSVTTTMACDANINTFRHVSNYFGIDLYIIDIPYEYSKDGEEYVVSQLHEMVEMIQDIMKVKLNEDELKRVLHTENLSRKYQLKYMKELSIRYFPNTLTLEMYKLFTSHIAMGRPETLEFYKRLYEDILTYDKCECKKFLWVHLLPFYQETLKKYFNNNKDMQLLACDLSFDYLEKLDVNNPYNAIAKKLILNHFNGPQLRRANSILHTAKTLNADAVINFCHWGCKQSNGGSMLLKKLMDKNNIPYLSIDGDGVDRRNSHDGQLRTRLEAFFEILKNNEQI
ncbi:2-hydroxyacyl-CoA dehydratase family protein [Clostridium sporogenes]|uniref:2-hydroxyacyl-CoA dehydratase n=1 Tax=Clostridium botulinum TaxID=1491 RepID=A0A6M0STZ6_CLOBO|nr:2-hydroxyacyl-CoA dehydratase family protein [Clostridium sporogenes]NFA58997.1 2-hydroxyacyl-CoA dehydratase [Clostridium botulinum]NFI72950.1 2-hydroxyacyl-CoA dehydratase [Clostridium sporogenes]NFL71399.1 2-hydroxyacyl-CoA dehydratase [Clostridium sporogenes]NFM22991.1 2-hydroxyacyl-CoA dehydratase [Clostridium sporogenes]NFP60363.1 2-hydroxyacyl-CoA dehydratase [Clostridium sporogenes]